MIPPISSQIMEFRPDITPKILVREVKALIHGTPHTPAEALRVCLELAKDSKPMPWEE